MTTRNTRNHTRLFVSIFAVFMLFLIATIPALAQNQPTVESTDGLIFTLENNNTSYSITDYVGVSTEIVIPSSYMGLPVTSIRSGIFPVPSLSTSGNGSTILPEDSFNGNTGVIPTKISIYAKHLSIPDVASVFPANAVIHGPAGSTAQAHAEKYNLTFVEIPGLPDILSANIELGATITVNYKVDPDTVAPQDLSMRFTANGTTTVVSGVEKDGYCVFSFKGIGPHMMGDTICAELLLNGAAVDVLDNYSVKQYCLNMLQEIQSENIEGYTNAQYSLLKTLIADLLQYGADAQVYANYNTSALVNQGIDGMSGYSAPSDIYANVSISASTALDNSHLMSAAMELSNTIRLRFSFATADASKVTVKIGNVTYDSGDFIKTQAMDNGLPVYLVYSESIYATQIEDSYEVTLLVNGSKCQTLTYGVLNYIHRKQNDANPALAALVRSIRNYGRSACAMVEYAQRSGSVAVYKANENLTYVNALAKALEQKFATVAVSDNATSVFSAGKYDTVIVAGVDTMSSSATAAMDSYLKNDGRVLMLGGAAMEKPYYLNGEYVTLGAYRENVINSSNKITLASMTSADTWQRVRDKGNVTKEDGNYGLANSSKQLYFAIDNLSSYALLQKSAPDNLPESNVLSFYAKAGDVQTNVFTLQIVDTHEQEWRLKVPISNDGWQHYAFTANDFAIVKGPASYPLEFNNITQIKIAFEVSFSKISEGAHSLYISDITLSDISNDAAFTAQTQYQLNGVAPLYEQYPITNAVDISADGAQVFVSDRNYVIPTGTNNLVSRYPGTTGAGYDKDTDIRFIPLLTATNEKGLFSGYVAWIDLYATQTTANGAFEGSMVGYFGMATDEFYNANGIAAVVEAATAMTRNVFIVDGGTNEFTYLPENTAINAGVKFVTLGSGEQGKVTATVSLYDGNRLLAQYTNANATAATLSNSIKTLSASYSRSKGEPDRAVAALYVDGQLVDMIEHEIHYWEAKQNPSFIYTEDGYFKIKKDGEKDSEIINFFGINYYPSYLGAAPDDATKEALNNLTSTYASFFSKGAYNPTIITNDLKLLKDIGMNAVSVQAPYDYVISSNNFLDFLRICEQQGLYVDVVLTANAYPLRRYNESKVQAQIQRLHLHENDTVISYDIAYEERIGSYTGDRGDAEDRYIGRDHWDDEWKAWVTLQYGSLAEAQKAWGTSISLTDGNLIITDAMLDDTTGKYHKVVAAYYRFIDDMVSIDMQKNLTHLQSLAPKQLISFRMSMSGSTLRTSSLKPSTHCFDFQSLASSMDFMQPEGYEVKPTTDSGLQIMFANAYARYTKPDAPVVWKEFGKTVWADRVDGNFYPSQAAIANGADYYRSFLERAYQSYTSGIYCWWSLPGFRANENSDYGVFNPDGSDRGEITKLLREYAPKFIGQGARDESKNVYIKVDRDDYVGGLFGMFDAVADDSRFSSAYADGNYVTFIGGSHNDDGSYKDADQLTTSYVADAKASSGTAPLAYVNGMIKDVKVYQQNGKTYADITVCNTKQSIWRANTVSIVSTSASGVSVNYTIPEQVDYLADVTVKVELSGSGTLALRFEVGGVQFGPLYTK